MAEASSQWVEIIEPASKEKMYTNPSTGEIVFTPPEGAEVKPMSSNQWWELYDGGTDRYYYYNAVTEQTIWKKPGDGADIISLTKLQQNSEAEAEAEVEATKGPSPSSPAAPHTNENTHSEADEVFNRKAISSPAEGRTKSPPTRKLSDMLTHEIEPLSPLKVDFPDDRFSPSANHPTTAEPSTHGQATATGASSPSSHSRADGSVELRDKSFKMTGGKSQVNYQEHEHGSWVNIKLVKEGRVSGDPVSGGDVASHRGGGEGALRPGEKKIITTSLDRTNRGRDNMGGGLGSSGKFDKSLTLDSRGKRGREPVRPAPGIPPNKVSPDTKLKSEVKPKPSSQQHGLASSSTSSTSSSNTSNTPPTPHASHTHTPAPAKPLGSPEKAKDRSKVGRVQSMVPQSPPAAPPFIPAKPRNRGQSLDKFDQLSTHKVGFLFKKKVTIANMLSWTKDPIKQPMIQTRDKQVKKEAIDLFRLVLQYMGDRKTRYKDLDQLALVICQRCWEKKELRDEIYIQLCRQTSSNDRPSSLERGWELIAVCLAFFPPSMKFRSYLEGYLWRNVEHKPEHKNVPVEKYAQYCHKKIEKMAQSGAKRGTKKPTIEEVMHAKKTPFNPSMFGTSVEEVMELQKSKFPDCQIPWVVQALVKAVVELEGPNTEGIFRVPGDIDEVNTLKLQMDKGHLPMDSLRDPHVPASLLKLWFRELEDPLIPEEYYDECIRNCNDEVNAVSLVGSLPDLNREVLIYLVKFLKEFVTPENISKTKMGLENIAMVWAPNFLRCPSDDHTLIFENTRKEMAFLRLLLKHLQTEDETDEL